MVGLGPVSARAEGAGGRIKIKSKRRNNFVSLGPISLFLVPAGIGQLERVWWIRILIVVIITTPAC
jgi:hypothetical protein